MFHVKHRKDINMTMTKYIKVTLTSLDNQSWFDVNEYKYNVEVDTRTENIELFYNGINKAINEYIPKLKEQGHTCVEVMGIQVFDYE